MAEQEVVKHTKKIYKIWKANDHGLWHQVKEMAIEIFIIVFAITLSIWLHNRSEQSHQQADVKEFLLGLRSDLTNDIAEMKEDVKAYKNQQAVFRYLVSIKLKDTLRTDSLAGRNTWLFNTTELNPNDGRFEGFKSSGKIGLIADKDLQNDIMDLYQENIPMLNISTSGYIVNKKRFLNYVQENRKRITDSTTNFNELIVTEAAYNFSSVLSNASEVLTRYNSCIKKMQKIVSAIDKDYQ